MKGSAGHCTWSSLDLVLTRRNSASCQDVTVEPGITAGAVAPGDVGRHAVPLQASPCRLVVEGGAGLAKGAAEIVCRHGAELEAGRGEASAGGLVDVDHGVIEAADPRHDWDRAVAQGTELGQAAGLEPRRHHQRV